MKEKGKVGRNEGRKVSRKVGRGDSKESSKEGRRKIARSDGWMDGSVELTERGGKEIDKQSRNESDRHKFQEFRKL